MSIQRIMVFTATYNEVDNIEQLLREIAKFLPGADIVVVDDASPDGTGELLDRLVSVTPQLQVIHRPRKSGLGTAHKLAMKYALQQGIDVLITMDADFSHHPHYLPELVSRLAEHDFVIGSRYMPGGKSDYGIFRSLLSRTANILVRYLLGIPLNECTTAYRGFRLSLLERFNVDAIRSEGYSFFVESLFYIGLLTKNITEFPIYFEDRRNGLSKISKIEIFKGFWTLLKLFFLKIFLLAPLKTRIQAPARTSYTPCAACGTSWKTEIYPATRQHKFDKHVYRCTSPGHRSHGSIVQCLQCGLVSQESQISPEAIRQKYVDVEDPVYVEHIAAREKTFRYNFSQIRPYLPENGRLLDVGAYCGVFLKIAREQGFDALGLEPSTWAVHYAREILGEPVIQGTLQDLPAETPPFDVITLWDVLEHFSNPAQELNLIASKLKPEGILAFSTLNIDSWFPWLLGKSWPWLMDMHLFYFTEPVLKHLLSQTGFDLIHAQSYCHIIRLEYLLTKLESLNIWGSAFLKQFLVKTPLARMSLPFRFGDIGLYITRKRKEKHVPDN